MHTYNVLQIFLTPQTIQPHKISLNHQPPFIWFQILRLIYNALVYIFHPILLRCEMTSSPLRIFVYFILRALIIYTSFLHYTIPFPVGFNSCQEHHALPFTLLPIVHGWTSTFSSIQIYTVLHPLLLFPYSVALQVYESVGFHLATEHTTSPVLWLILDRYIYSIKMRSP